MTSNVYCLLLTGKGDLHAHMCIIQPNLQPQRLQALLQHSPTELMHFAETLMCRVVPDVPTSSLVHSDADAKPASYEVPLSAPMTPSDASTLHAQVASAQMDLQYHHHTFTCKKNGFLGTDLSCRVTMPRPIVKCTQIFKNTCAMLVKCTNGHIAPHVRSLLLAQPCNMAVWLSCKASSYYRDFHIWALAKLHNLSSASPPQLPPLEAFAAEKAEYALKYSTKNDSYNLNGSITEAAIEMLEKAVASVSHACDTGW